MRIPMVVMNMQLVKILLEITFVHALKVFLAMAKSVKVNTVLIQNMRIDVCVDQYS